MLRARLTTIDNPHDPFDDYPQWFAFDTASGYHSAALLARILQDSHELSEEDEELAISEAIDEIVKENVLGVFRKVTRDVPEED